MLDNSIGITLLPSAFSKLQQFFSLKFENLNLEVFVVPAHHLQYLLRERKGGGSGSNTLSWVRAYNLLLTVLTNEPVRPYHGCNDIWFPLQFLQPSTELFFVLKRKVKITLMYQLDILVCNFETFPRDRYIHSWNVKWQKKIRIICWFSILAEYLKARRM